MESPGGEISQKLIAAVLLANANRNLGQVKLSLLVFLYVVLVSSYPSLALTYAVAGTADPVAAGLWYLPMGQAEVQAASLVPRYNRCISLRQVGHLAVERSPRVGEFN